MTILDLQNKNYKLTEDNQQKDLTIKKQATELDETKGVLTKLVDVRNVLNRLLGQGDFNEAKQKLLASVEPTIQNTNRQGSIDRTLDSTYQAQNKKPE